MAGAGCCAAVQAWLLNPGDVEGGTRLLMVEAQVDRSIRHRLSA